MFYANTQKHSHDRRRTMAHGVINNDLSEKPWKKAKNARGVTFRFSPYFSVLF